MSRSPSPIGSKSDKEEGNSVTHESYGFQPHHNNSYSLAYSATPLAVLGQDSREPNSSDLGEIGDASQVIRLPSDDSEEVNMEGYNSMATSVDPTGRRHAKTETTRVLERVTEMHENHIERPKYTQIPPQRVKSRYYSDHVKNQTDSSGAYLQILIWCLQRRISMLNESPPTNLITSTRLELIHALQTFQSRLMSGAFIPESRSHGLLNLKPRMSNPENKRSEEIVAGLQRLRRLHIAENRKSWQELKQAEDSIGRDNKRPDEGPTESPERLESKKFIESSYGAAFKRSVKERNEILQAFLRNITTVDALYAKGTHEVREALEYLGQNVAGNLHM